MEDEDGGAPAEPHRRKAAATATLNISKKSGTRLKRVSSILRKKNELLTPDDRRVLEENAELVKAYHKRQEKRKVWLSRKNEEEDTQEELQTKCEELAQAIHDAQFLVVYTGAGISTAASIPDYRGPNGIWTRLQKGEDIGHHDLTSAEPTLTHMALSALYQQGIVRHVVSQNCDGLHLRSGLPKSAMSEVHGNMYIEVCRHCVPPREYVRTFDVTERTSTFKHTTGRRCYRCGEPLVDTIVHFGERGKLRWPLNWQGACQAANACDTILCLGSSLKVLKKYTWLWQMDRPPKKRPKLYIVNLQWTPKDKDATLKINGKCDEVMNLVMEALGYELPLYSRLSDPIFSLATELHHAEGATSSRPRLLPPQEAEDTGEEVDVVGEGTSAPDVRWKEGETGLQDRKVETDLTKEELKEEVKEEVKEEQEVKPNGFCKGWGASRSHWGRENKDLKPLSSESLEGEVKVEDVKEEDVKKDEEGEIKMEETNIERGKENEEVKEEDGENDEEEEVRGDGMEEGQLYWGIMGHKEEGEVKGEERSNTRDSEEDEEPFTEQEEEGEEEEEGWTSEQNQEDMVAVDSYCSVSDSSDRMEDEEEDDLDCCESGMNGYLEDQCEGMSEGYYEEFVVGDEEEEEEEDEEGGVENVGGKGKEELAMEVEGTTLDEVAEVEGDEWIGDMEDQNGCGDPSTHGGNSKVECGKQTSSTSSPRSSPPLLPTACNPPLFRHNHFYGTGLCIRSSARPAPSKDSEGGDREERERRNSQVSFPLEKSSSSLPLASTQSQLPPASLIEQVTASNPLSECAANSPCVGEVGLDRVSTPAVTNSAQEDPSTGEGSVGSGDGENSSVGDGQNNVVSGTVGDEQNSVLDLSGVTAQDKLWQEQTRQDFISVHPGTDVERLKEEERRQGVGESTEDGEEGQDGCLENSQRKKRKPHPNMVSVCTQTDDDGSFVLRAHVVDGVLGLDGKAGMLLNPHPPQSAPPLGHIPPIMGFQPRATFFAPRDLSSGCIRGSGMHLVPPANPIPLSLTFPQQVDMSESQELKSIWYQSFCGTNTHPKLSLAAMMGLQGVRPGGLGTLSNAPHLHPSPPHPSSGSLILKDICASAVSDSAGGRRGGLGGRKRARGDHDEVKCIWFWGFDSNDQEAAGTRRGWPVRDGSMQDGDGAGQEGMEVAKEEEEEEKEEEEEEDHPVARITRSQTRASGEGQGQLGDEDGVGEPACHCPGSNPALCQALRRRGVPQLCDDEGVQKARDIINRRRTVNYRRYEPVFEKELESLTCVPKRPRRKKVLDVTTCPKDDLGRTDETPEVNGRELDVGGQQAVEGGEEREKKVTPSWYGKGLRKAIKKKKS